MTAKQAYTKPASLNIVGEHVALGPFRRDLVETMWRWENNYATRVTDDPAEARPMTMEEAYATYDEWARSGGGRRLQFMVYEIATWRPIGLTVLRDVNWQNRNAVFGIMIGETDARGKGLGTEATRLTLDQAFTIMGLHSVLLDVVTFNAAAIRAYTRAGFREVGRWREAAQVNQRYYDIVFMDCLASEFESTVLARIYTGGA